MQKGAKKDIKKAQGLGASLRTEKVDRLLEDCLQVLLSFDFGTDSQDQEFLKEVRKRIYLHLAFSGV